MIKFDKNEFLEPMIYSTNDKYKTRSRVSKEIVEDIKNLQIEKQQLITWLEDKIKNLESYAISFGLTIDREIAQEIEIKRIVYKNVLDFVNIGGKE